MSTLPANPALKPFDELIGDWEFQSPQWGEGTGRATFRWSEGGAYLCWRSEVPDPAPDSIWIVGSDESGDRCTALYYDSRTVGRAYWMTFRDRTWTVWREDPGSWQRFTGALSDDAATIRGAWEWSRDGTTWEPDFDLVYRRIRERSPA
ncbi:MAG: hypothetical protein ACREQM_05065 [Candidatus Dormibacteraceae bacterium]